MRGFALTLCRVFALLACFVCASGYATSARAQPFASSSPHDEVCRAEHDAGPASDFGSPSSGSDFAEHDDDDDCSEEPTALLIHARPEPASWESARAQRPHACDPRISDHRTLEPRPPRSI
jgi:hypothetical protein